MLKGNKHGFSIQKAQLLFLFWFDLIQYKWEIFCKYRVIDSGTEM